MSLPVPPQILAAPQHGPVGPIQQVQSPYGATPASAAAQGIATLITGLMANKANKKREAAATWQAGMSALGAGMPGVDMTKLAKAGKTLGLPFDFEGKTTNVTQPPPTLGPAATMPVANGVQGGFSVDPATAAVLAAAQNSRSATQGPPPQNASQMQNPSTLAKLGQFLGLASPSVAPNAGVYEALREVQRKGTAADEMQRLTESSNAEKLRVGLAATRDLVAGRRDTPAVQAAQQLKILDAPTGVEALSVLGERTGLSRQAVSDALFDHFSGRQNERMTAMRELADMAAQNAQMGIKATEQALQIAKEHPGMNVADAYAATAALMSQDKDRVEAGRKFLAGFRTKTTSEEQRAQQGEARAERGEKRQERELELKAEQVRGMWARVGLEGQNVGIAQRGQAIRLLEVQNAVQKQLYEADKDAMDRFARVLYGDKGNEKERQAAINGILGAAHRMKTRELTAPDGSKFKFDFGSLKAEDMSWFGGMFGSKMGISTGAAGFTDSDLNIGTPGTRPEDDPNYLPNLAPGGRALPPPPPMPPSSGIPQSMRPYGVTPYGVVPRR